MSELFGFFVCVVIALSIRHAFKIYNDSKHLKYAQEKANRTNSVVRLCIDVNGRYETLIRGQSIPPTMRIVAVLEPLK